MPSGMTAEAFCETHCEAIVTWLRDNTTECACDTIRFGPDDKLQRGDLIDTTTVILCRRCYVPVGRATRWQHASALPLHASVTS